MNGYIAKIYHDHLDTDATHIAAMADISKENAVFPVKRIVITSIDWHAPESANLPERIVIDINDSNRHLLEDSEQICNFLSDEYGYCINSFVAEKEE